MRIYLNTRGFEQDYQWFNIAEDNTISISKNWWEMKEISKLPITDDFSVTMGKFENGELFLIVTDMQSEREDNKGRDIKNSFLFISTDEVILRKLATLFIFDYEDLTDKLNFLISDFQEGEFGFTVEYTQIVFAIDSLLDRYDVKFEFDANTNETHQSRFGELFLQFGTQNEAGEEIIGYRLNPIFEFKLKRFLLSEIFPEDINIIFAYLPNLSLKNIEEAKIYLSVGKTLDKFAKNIFLRDLEDWAKIEMKESRFKQFKDKIGRYKSEIIALSLALIIFLPFVISYVNLSILNGELQKENVLLKADKLAIQLQNSNLSETLKNSNIVEVKENITEDNRIEHTKKLKDIEDKLFIAEETNAKLVVELSRSKDVITTLEKKLHKRESQETRNEILTLRNQLDKCESQKQKEMTQRGKLAVGYKWYKDLYSKCKNGE